jgi:CheY-like chemotaxis protein
MPKNIVIVDDDKIFCKYIKKGLELSGDFKISVCNDSGEAVKNITAMQPDVILLDVAMPDKSGSEIASELKDDEKLKNIPVIFMTSLVKEEETEEGQNIIGGRYFMAKPVDIDELKGLIDKVSGK